MSRQTILGVLNSWWPLIPPILFGQLCQFLPRLMSVATSAAPPGFRCFVTWAWAIMGQMFWVTPKGL